jgi:hypothetical protein
MSEGGVMAVDESVLGGITGEPSEPPASTETNGAAHVETGTEKSKRLRNEAAIARAEAAKASAEVSLRATAARKEKLDEQAAKKARRAKAKLRLVNDDDEAWRAKLIVEVNMDGELRTKAVLANVVTILRQRPGLVASRRA